MSKLNVALISNNFLKVYYYEKRDNLLAGTPFFSIPISEDLAHGSEIVNYEEVKSLLLPQIARANEQIKYKDLLAIIPPSEVFTFIAKVDGNPAPEEIFEQARPFLKYSLPEAEILVKKAKDGHAQAYIIKRDYLMMLKNIFKSATFHLKAIVPFPEILANITSDIKEPHIMLSKLENQIVGVLINNNMIEEIEVVTIDDKPVETATAAEPEKEAEIVGNKPDLEQAPPPAPAASASTDSMPSKAAEMVKKLQEKAKVLGTPAKEIFLADKFTQAWQQSLQTEDNMIKIVQIPFEGEIDSSAYAMILPSDTYSDKGVNFWYLGENTSSQNSGKKRNMGKVIIVVLIVLLLGGGGVWYFLQSQSKNSSPSVTSNTVTPTEAPITVAVNQASPSASPTPSVTLDRKNLKIQVLNGGGKTGEAARIKGILEEKGYVVTGTGNGGAAEATTLQLKPIKKEYLNLVTKDLEGIYAVTAGGELPESSGNDAVLTIGTK